MTARRLLRRAALVPIALAVLALALSACGGATTAAGQASGSRPHTSAQLAILQPTANAVTGSNVSIVLSLTGAHIVPSTSSNVRPDEGHIHLYVDSRLVSMYYKLTETITGLKPGPHSVRAEFVGSDHLPFANRVVASVLFTVQ